MNRLVSGLTTRLDTTRGAPVAGQQSALRELWSITSAQAETLSCADAFRAVMLAFAVAACLVPLMRKMAPPKAPPPP